MKGLQDDARRRQRIAVPVSLSCFADYASLPHFVSGRGITDGKRAPKSMRSQLAKRGLLDNPGTGCRIEIVCLRSQKLSLRKLQHLVLSSTLASLPAAIQVAKKHPSSLRVPVSLRLLSLLQRSLQRSRNELRRLLPFAGEGQAFRRSLDLSGPTTCWLFRSFLIGCFVVETKQREQGHLPPRPRGILFVEPTKRNRSSSQPSTAHALACRKSNRENLEHEGFACLSRVPSASTVQSVLRFSRNRCR